MDKILILIAFGLLVSLSLFASKSVKPEDFWQGDYCVQKTALTAEEGSRSVRAKVEGKWENFTLVQFPQGLWDWARNGRMEYLDIFREMIELGPKATRSPQLSGPHNGIVATYGAARKDSRFKLNNAVKGMGFLPKQEKMAELLSLIRDNKDATLDVKLNILDSLYQEAERNFSGDRLVSLELYSEPGYTTQTFLNQMVNPACVTVWMDIPTYKVKQIARLLHPNDPNLTTYEKQVVEYVNLMHSFFHGEFPRDYIAVIYYNIEVYDSSPGRPDARGTKITN